MNELSEEKMPQENATTTPLTEKKITPEEIIARLKEVVTLPLDEGREEVDTLKQTYYKLRKQEVDEAMRAFAADTQKPEDALFYAPVDEWEDTLKNLLAEYKERRTAFLLEQEKTKNENLATKNSILEELRSMTEDVDNVGKRYNEFKELQQRFKETGNIPASQVTETWQRFHLYTEAIYDLIKINKELRDYDFKKNLETKSELCTSAEELAAQTESDIIEIFKRLQVLHEEWRAIGPVAKELRNDVWNRFKEASTLINKRHQLHFEAIKQQEEANEKAKSTICEEIENIDLTTLTSFGTWDEATKRVIALQEEWKKTGYGSRKNNASLYERYRAACDNFFHRKAAFFNTMKEELSINLEKKKLLCEKAEALKESTDWRLSTELLVALQKEWKSIGTVNKKYSDQLWKRFVAACDYFFEQKQKQTATERQSQAANLAEKQQIIVELTALAATTAPDTKIIHELINRWKQIGHVPFKEKDALYADFKQLLDKLFAQIDTQQSHNRVKSFNMRLEAMTSGAERPQNTLLREREKLMRALDIARNELKTYSNNLGFLSVSSKQGNSLLAEVERKMEKLNKEIILLEEKINTIDSKLNT